ncbi:class I SAM-dependent methyltransferase [Paenibacillus pseudetheri]|uniref:Class I SAM-dependent methyltransferase n=1 Tax=Paenibacillus pseudetheri TaxID=2897682 RepID=A0ABN8FV31_9BACL|nr:class I SAM-dependent methyltransferase [Paenibacillus pseudetheri]CAH1059494.1 hypothetical protein PAECIP111894_05703 [Paenibacillus pseudetheri]
MSGWKISNPIFESDNLNEKLNVSPWAGHRRFVYDLLGFVRPQNILELGTHYGCSFFAMCQAIKDFNIDTKIHAVDTWMGDPQAGFYGEEVYDLVKKTIEKFFSGISTETHKMTFDEALLQFNDGYFDIIHIDGFHEYDAVKHDFLTSLPKLNDNGIVLFHDIAADTGYGSSLFWDEIKLEYNSFEFSHSWGLGILFPKGNKVFDLMIVENIHDKLLYYNARSELDIAQIKVKDLEILGLERFNIIGKMDRMIKQRDDSIEAQGRLLEERFESMVKMETMIEERDNIISSQNKIIKERFNSINQMENMIKERDVVINSQAQLLEERIDIIQKMDSMIKERDDVITAQKRMLDERYQTVVDMESMIKERDNAINNQAILLEERDIAIEQMDQMIKERDNTINNQGILLEERYNAIEQMDQMIKERDDTISKLS